MTEIQDSEDKYRKLIETANDAIIVADGETGIIIDVNRKAEALLDMPRDRIKGMHQSQLHPPEEAERYKEIFIKHITAGSAITEPLFVVNTSGKKIPVEISASIAEFQGKKIIQGIFRDISERLETQRSLVESEERFYKAFENAPIGMALVSLDQKIFQANSALCTILGYDKDELTGKTIREVTHPDDLEKETPHKEQMLKGEGVRYQIAKRYMHADGHTVWGKLSVSLIKSDNGEPRYYIGQLEDITDQKNMEKELKDRIRELEEFYKMAVGREIKMKELKEENARLKAELAK